MANPNPDQSHLKPIHSKKRARKLGALGGKISGEKKREKKLLSQIYGEILADENGVDGKGKTLDKVVKEILDSCNYKTTSARVALLKELREATEGSKMALTGPDGEALKTEGIKIVIVHPDPLKQIDDEHTTAG